MAHTPDRATENPIYSELDEEIQRLRNLQPRNDEASLSRKVIYGGDQRENVLIYELLQKIRKLRLQLIGPPENEHANRDDRRRKTFEQFSNLSVRSNLRANARKCAQSTRTFVWVFDIKRNKKYDRNLMAI